MTKKQLFILLFLTIIFGTSSALFAQTQTSVFINLPDLEKAILAAKPTVWTDDPKSKGTVEYDKYKIFKNISSGLNTIPFVKDGEIKVRIATKVDGTELRNAYLFMSLLSSGNKLDVKGQELLTRALFQKEGDNKFDVTVKDENRSKEELATMDKRFKRATDLVSALLFLDDLEKNSLKFEFDTIQ